MYSYNWDSETGGYLLLSTPSVFSKEPRPVYYKELDILGLDSHWNYQKDDSLPYMWAEANSYYYRGKLVAKTKGGSLYTAPEVIFAEEPEENGGDLRFVDLNAMVEKNNTIMDSLVNATIKKVYNTYIEYKDKIDVFYVAFSGGKDSIALLDIVKQALPHNSFKVLFGDTGMEFPDTYDVVEKVKKLCFDENIDFLIAKSELTPEMSWKEFGPPAQILRWCCSVHKTSPQILLLRKLTKKPNFTGMAFTGVRGDESASRSEYEDISLGEKHKGQYSFHPILEWNSAELYLYIYGNNLVINDAYKKGNSRAGCLVCPMAANKNEFFKEISYSKRINHKMCTTDFNNLILENTMKSFNSKSEADFFMDIGGWKARRSGRELRIHKDYCLDSYSNGIFKIELLHENSPWREWLKTVGEIVDNNKQEITIIFEEKKYQIRVNYEEGKCLIIVPISTNSNTDIRFMSALKFIFRKSAYCIKCKVCEANCPHGFISMGERLVISNDCISCKKCHKVDYGCLVANSLRMPKGERKNMNSIDRYFNMGFEFDWVSSYFKEFDSFWGENGGVSKLGSKKIVILKRFLADAEITNNNCVTKFGKIINNISIDSDVAWGLILVNLSYTSQFNWYIKNILNDQTYSSEAIKMLIGDEMTENSKTNIVSAFKNIFISIEPLGKKIGLGICNYEDKNGKRFLIDITRSMWQNPYPLVILYSLYKFAEACGEYYQFTLTRLLNHSIDSDGVSPTQIFGLDRETMEIILNGLTINYPEFISASFTLDLDNITLRSDKTSQDVLELF